MSNKRMNIKSVVSVSTLLLLFVAFWSYTSLFTHRHLVDGRLIAHSHPYSQGVEHTHTVAEFFSIDAAATLDSPVAEGFVVVVAVVYLLVSRGCETSSIPLSKYLGSSRSLRAPPGFSF